MRKSLLPLALLCMVAVSHPLAHPSFQNPSTVAAAPIPDVVLAQWQDLVGVWIADNSAYKTDANPIDAYGIEWKWGLGKKSLTGRLYGIRDEKEIGTFWEFREFWHPGDRTVVATQFGGNGVFGTGSHTIRPDGTSEMVQTFFDPGAGTAARVGHRATLNGDVHTTTSFDVNASGTWTERSTYVWRRRVTPPTPNAIPVR